MNKKTINLIILTPYGKYFEGEVLSLHVHSEDYFLGIYPNHEPLISTISVSPMEINFNGNKYYYAVGGGIINIEKDKTTLILDSIERTDEIDINRALEAKKRAEARLEDKSNQNIDFKRAKEALARAINRINLNKNH